MNTSKHTTENKEYMLSDNRTSETEESWFGKYAVHIGVVTGTVLGLMYAFPIIGEALENKAIYEELSSRSSAHSILVGTYRDCRRGFISGSQAECVIQMKSIAEVEGLSKEFDLVYQDMKTDLWAINKSG